MVWLVDSVHNWCNSLDVDCPSREELFGILDRLGSAADSGGLEVSPHFIGERHAPDLRGAITGVTPSNLTLGNLTRALAYGVVGNLRTMLPDACFDGRSLVVGSGNALRRLPVMQACVRDVFDVPLELTPDCEEAALGAALLAGECVADAGAC